MTQKDTRTRSRFKKPLLVVGAVIALIALLGLGFLMQPTYATSAETLAFAEEAVTRQQTIEKDLQAYYQTGKYTFEEPLVIQNPYQIAPLTALLIFDTAEPSQISIRVPGKTAQAEVEYTFAGYQRHHEVPVYGLYADTLNHVTVGMRTEKGASAQTEVDLQTEPLPIDLPSFQVVKVNPDKYNPGFNFAFLDRKPVFDINGEVRWYSSSVSYPVFTQLKNGRFLFTYSKDNADNVDTVIMEQDLLGRIYAIYHVANGIHHDIYELPNGNLLITTSDLKSDTVEDYIIELDRNSGHIVRSFDLKRFLDASRPTVLELNSKDWLHLNSIIYDPADQTIIISSKGQSAVIKMTYPGMQIKWILGPHDNWNARFQPYLLTPVGEPFEWPWSQHHATLYGPHLAGENIVNILLFDNSIYRSFDFANAQSPLDWYSRVVHYRIDETAMTIEQVWEYGQERSAEIFAFNRGSAYLLPNGNVLGTWGAIAKDAQGNPVARTPLTVSYETKIIEVDPMNSEVIFECTLPSTWTYRALRAGFYDGYSETSESNSSALKDHTRNDLVDRSMIVWQDILRWSYNDPMMISLRRFARQILSSIR